MQIIVVLHVYKGNNGDKLALQYLSLFLHLAGKSSHRFRVYVYCYGFSSLDEVDIAKSFEGAVCPPVEISIVFQLKCFSEVPTLREAAMLCRDSGSNDLLVYFHSKGASYIDQQFFVAWSLYAIAALSAAVQTISADPSLLERYYAIGSFAGIGVFERFGTMTPAFSGNFWLTKAIRFSSLHIQDSWYSDLAHNRHYAEGLLCKQVQPECLLNLEDSYQLRAVSCFDGEMVFKKIMYELALLSMASEEELDAVEVFLEFFYSHLVAQQKRYSSQRTAWFVRKRIFGNSSPLRLLPYVSRLFDRIIPWADCELYRGYTGPKQVDILRNIRAERVFCDFY
jgi:hypothetical protein